MSGKVTPLVMRTLRPGTGKPACARRPSQVYIRQKETIANLDKQLHLRRDKGPAKATCSFAYARYTGGGPSSHHRRRRRKLVLGPVAALAGHDDPGERERLEENLGIEDYTHH